MKALLLIFMLPLSTLFSGLSPNAEDATNNLGAKKIEVEVEVDLGRKKKGCTGFGVCKITAGTKIMGALEGTRAAATATTENGRVTSLNFHKSSMSEATLKEFFSGDGFRVGESFLINFKADDKEYTVGLRAGIHKIKRTRNGFNLGMPPN